MVYQLDSGQIMLEFGHGDILVPMWTKAEAQRPDDDDFAYVGFTQAKNTYQIGENTLNKNESNYPDVIMAFDKVESVDVVMKALQFVREHLASENKTNNDEKTD